MTHPAGQQDMSERDLMLTSVADAPRNAMQDSAPSQSRGEEKRTYVAPPGVEIECIGGNCPVQAEGTVDGKEFYFRARGESWSMSIGGSDIILEPEWYYEEDYGDEPFAAGWMSLYEAHNFIEKAIGLYRAAQSVSDGSPQGQDAKRLDPKDESAVGNAETPVPSPAQPKESGND